MRPAHNWGARPETMKAPISSLAAAMAATSLLWVPSLCDITQGVTPALFARLDRE